MIQVLGRFHKILLAVSNAGETGCSISELAAMLNVSAPACSNIVRTMVELDYLRSLGPRQKYVLGDMPSFIARNGSFCQALMSVSKQPVSEMGEKINELTVLVVEYNCNRYEIMRIDSKKPIKVEAKLYHDIPLMNCPTGAVILSGKERDFRKKCWDLNKGRPNCLGISDFEGFNKKLDEIRKNGKLILESDEKNLSLKMQTLVTMGFAIYSKGKIVAALGVLVPAMRFHEPQDRERILKTAEETASKITAALS